MLACGLTLRLIDQKYRSYVNALREQHETKPLPLACLRILDSLDGEIWSDSSVPPYKPSVKKNLCNALVKMLKTTKGTEEVRRLFGSIVQDIDQLLDGRYFVSQLRH